MDDFSDISDNDITNSVVEAESCLPSIESSSAEYVDSSRGKREEIQRLRRWFSFSTRRLLTLDDLDKDVAPSIGKDYQTFALQIKSVDPWPTPKALVTRSCEVPNTMTFALSVILSCGFQTFFWLYLDGL